MRPQAHLRSLAARSLSPRAATSLYRLSNSHGTILGSFNQGRLATDHSLRVRSFLATHRHESIHRHTRRRLRTSWIDESVSSISRAIVASPARCLIGGHAQTCMILSIPPNNHDTYACRNRPPNNPRSYSTTVSRQSFIPKSFPSRVSNNAKPDTKQAADVLRRRGVAPAPDENRTYREIDLETEEQNRKAKEKARKKALETRELQFKGQYNAILRSAEQLEKEWTSLGLRESFSPAVFLKNYQRQALFEYFATALRETEEISCDVALTILRDIYCADLWSDSLLQLLRQLVMARLEARNLRKAKECELLALELAQERNKRGETWSKMSLPEMLSELDDERNKRWTHVIHQILEQFNQGGLYQKFRTKLQMVEHGGRAIVDAIQGAVEEELGLEEGEYVKQQRLLMRPGLSCCAAGLIVGRQLFSEEALGADGHHLRAWSRVALRYSLAPDIFRHEIAYNRLKNKLEAVAQEAASIRVHMANIIKDTSLTRRDFSEERLRILAELLVCKAREARDHGRDVSGFCSLHFSQAADHEEPQIQHRIVFEAELRKACWRIFSFCGKAGSLIDSLTEIRDLHKHHRQPIGASKGLIDLQHKLQNHYIPSFNGMLHGLRSSSDQFTFWRGMRLQQLSRWGQVKLPKYSRATQDSATSHIEHLRVSLPHSAPLKTEETADSSMGPLRESDTPQSGGPMIKYANTWTYAHRVLEEFRSSSVLGFDILSFPELPGVPETSHRSQIQALLLASENEVAIFHFAAFDGWDLELQHLSALKDVLESKHILKVGVNMKQHAQHLINHTTIDLDNFVELGRGVPDAGITQKIIGNKINDSLSELAMTYFGKTLPSLAFPHHITTFGLTRISFIQYLASRPYAALKLHKILWNRGKDRFLDATGLVGTQIQDSSSILGKQLGEITIDPYWIDGGDLDLTGRRAYDRDRSRLFSQEATSRRQCLEALAYDLATIIIPSKGKRNEHKMEELRLDFKAMYLRVYFGEHLELSSTSKKPRYTTGRILEIAKAHNIEIPSDRKSELEEEKDPVEQADNWLDSVLKSGPSKVLIASLEHIRSERDRLRREHDRDILLIYAVWHCTSEEFGWIASRFDVTSDQIKSDIHLVVSLKLFHAVQRKLDILNAGSKQKILSSGDGPFPDRPGFKAMSGYPKVAEPTGDELRSRAKEAATLALREQIRQQWKASKIRPSKRDKSLGLQRLKIEHNHTPFNSETVSGKLISVSSSLRSSNINKKIVRRMSREELERALLQTARENRALQESKSEKNERSPGETEREHSHGSRQTPMLSSRVTGAIENAGDKAPSASTDVDSEKKKQIPLTNAKEQKSVGEKSPPAEEETVFGFPSMFFQGPSDPLPSSPSALAPIDSTQRADTGEDAVMVSTTNMLPPLGIRKVRTMMARPLVEFKMIQQRILLRAKEAKAGISLQGSPTPLSDHERVALKLGISLSEFLARKEQQVHKVANAIGSPLPEDFNVDAMTQAMSVIVYRKEIMGMIRLRKQFMLRAEEAKAGIPLDDSTKPLMSDERRALQNKVPLPEILDQRERRVRELARMTGLPVPDDLASVNQTADAKISATSTPRSHETDTEEQIPPANAKGPSAQQKLSSKETSNPDEMDSGIAPEKTSTPLDVPVKRPSAVSRLVHRLPSLPPIPTLKKLRVVPPNPLVRRPASTLPVCIWKEPSVVVRKRISKRLVPVRKTGVTEVGVEVVSLAKAQAIGERRRTGTGST